MHGGSSEKYKWIIVVAGSSFFRKSLKAKRVKARTKKPTTHNDDTHNNPQLTAVVEKREDESLFFPRH